MKKSKSQIPEILLKPIIVDSLKVPTILVAGSEKKRAEAIETSFRSNVKIAQPEAIKKLMILVEFSGLDSTKKDFWENFCIFLIQNFVPGFQVREKNKEGPKVKWGFQEQIKLYLDVREIMRGNARISEHAACERLEQRAPWKSILKTSPNAVSKNSLYKQFHRAKKSEFIKAIQKIEALEKDFPEVSELLHEPPPINESISGVTL